jgi:hypothetical protein
MTALAADRNTQSKIGGIQIYPVEAGDIIYKGAMVAVDADGYLHPAQDAAAHKVVGVADEYVSNALGADGAVSCRVVSGRSFKFAASSITQAMLGEMMYAVDDQTFDDAIGTNAVKVGRLVQFVSTTEGWIFIPFGGLGLGIVTADGSDAATTQALANAIKAAYNNNLLG